MSRCLYERLSLASAKRGGDLPKKESRRLSARIGFVQAGAVDELVEALSLAGLHCWYFANIGEQEERDEFVKKCLTCSREAVKLSKEVDNPYFKALAMWAGAFLATLFFSDEIESSLKFAKEMLEHSSTTRDHY